MNADIAIISVLLLTIAFLIWERVKPGRNVQHKRTINIQQLGRNLPGMLYQCDNHQDWPMDFVSEGCLELTGYDKGGFESRTVLWGNLIHNKDREHVWSSVQDAISKDTGFELEYRIIDANGEVCWVWERGHAKESDSGEIKLEGFITDITSRKQAQEELLNSEHFLSAVIDTAVESLVTINQYGIIEMFNDKAQQLFSYAESEVLGKNVSVLMPEPYRTEHNAYLIRYLNSKEARIIGKGRELEAQRKDGTVFPIFLRIGEIESLGEKKFVALIRDITEERATEREASQNREHLAHMDRLQMMGEMASGIAHEINQPLTAISLFAQASKRLLATGQREKLPEIFDKLSEHAQRAGTIIERMQNMVSENSREKEVLDCNDMIQEIIDLAKTEARLYDVKINTQFSEEKLELIADKVQIQQVVLNLIRNAMEAMAAIDYTHGKSVLIESCRQDDSSIEIRVTDCGGGVSDEVAADVFDPFSTTKQAGIGMGLSISHSIITAHGGQMGFENNKNYGASFYFSLPGNETGESNE